MSEPSRARRLVGGAAAAAALVASVALLNWRTGLHPAELVAVAALVLTLAWRVVADRRADQGQTDRASLEKQVSRLSFRDGLTGLANRDMFLSRVQHALAQRSRDGGVVAVLLVDLDGFKAANDSLGHRVGDQLLVRTAERLRECLRPGDTVARLGADEFAVLVSGADQVDMSELVAQRCLQALSAPFHVDSHEICISASVGIAIAPPESTADELLRNAGLAMHQAKLHGRGRAESFEPRMHAAVQTRMELENDLRRALERDELSVVYQPILDLDTNTPVGVEALLRWHHPTRGEIPPLDFIGIAEECGLIVPIGRWVLEQSCRQVRRWQNTGSPRLRLSVNLSARQLSAPKTAEHVEATLKACGLEPSQLVLEITESMLVEDTERTLLKLQMLRDLGVHVAVDDFGTGYSSLAYLRRLPVSVLKIDRTFISGVGDSGALHALSNTIVELGRSLGLETVAEGIEELDQLLRLRAMGCTLGQGFYFAKPLPPDVVAPLLRGIPIAPAQRDVRT